MPSYTYRAKDKSGNTIDGVVDADNTKLAADKIREMGCWPLDVKEQGGVDLRQPAVNRSLRVGGNPVFTGVSTRSLTVFFRQLATMLHAGMILSESLDSLGRQRSIGKLAGIALRGADRVRSGELFSDIMAANPRIFSSAQTGLFRAGETGGMLDTMVDKIAVYLERELALRQKFARATFYPKLLIGFLAIFLIFFRHLVPIVLGGLPVLLTVVRTSVLPLLGILLAVYVSAKLLLTLQPVRYGWDGFKLSFPVLGMASRKLAMARLSTSMSVMYSAGIPISQAIEVGANATGNEVIRRALMKSIPAVQAGAPLTESIKNVGQIPELVVSMLSTGERTGDLGGTLDKVAEYYEDEAATTLEKTSHVLFVLLILTLGICIGKIVIDFWTGYFNGLLSSGGTQ